MSAMAEVPEDNKDTIFKNGICLVEEGEAMSEPKLDPIWRDFVLLGLIGLAGLAVLAIVLWAVVVVL